MRAIVSLILILFIFLAACSSNSAKQRKRIFKHPPRELSKAKQPIPSIKKDRRKIKKNILPAKKNNLSPIDFKKNILLPTQIHSINGTLMVLVNPLDHKKNRLSLINKKSISLNKRLNTTNKLKAFYIDHTEVTLEQYIKTHPKHNEITLSEKISCPSCPTMGVDWNNATKHCRLIGKRLPTEEEWELAGQGSSKSSLNLTNKKREPRANLIGAKDGFISVAPVGSFPLGAGPYGAMDMIGNVWEWVSTPHSPFPKNATYKKYKTLRVSKGGSWASPHYVANTSYRNVVDGNTKNPTFGFRCAKSIN